MFAYSRAVLAMSQPVLAQLDRTAFKQVVRVPAVRVPTKSCNDLMKKLRGYTFDLPKTKCIVHDGDRTDVRLLLLKESIDPTALNPEIQSVLQQLNTYEVVSHDVQLEYHHFSADAILRKLLPAGVDVPTSFESIGHIAHLNLREEQLPYKNIIGQVIMDKNPSIRTVINKVGTIENEFRVFQMEVIAGEQQFDTEVSQHGVRFRLDFSKVYWNSRLETEHKRLVTSFQPGEVVVDIMAGIGPFAVPAGVKGCRVYANDLNPESAKYLNVNIQLNRVSEKVLPFNMDGRQFVRLLLATPGGPIQQLLPAEAAQQSSAADEQQQQQQQEPECTQQQQQQQLLQQHPEQEQQTGCSRPDGQQPGTADSAEQPKQQQQQQQQQHQQQQEQQRQRSHKPNLVPAVPPPVPQGFRPQAGGLLFHHAIMNLPASAVEFLDAFHGAFDPDTWKGRLPLVHVYTFKKNEAEADVIARIEAALGGKLDAQPQIHVVRDVAPNKLMLCVTFRVPEAVAFAGRQPSNAQKEQQAEVENCSPVAKRPRT